MKQLADKPFAIIGVNSDPDLEKIRKIAQEKNLTWRSFWNGEEGIRGPISSAWKVNAWPTVYLMDGDGVIRFINPKGDALDRAIEQLLAETGHDVKLDFESH